MNFHNSSQPFLRSINQVGAETESLSQKMIKFPTSFSFWKPVGKILFFVLPLVLAVNMYTSSVANRMNKAIIVVDNIHHELMDRNIELRAMKAQLRNPEQLQEMVAEKLSLYSHTKGQVGIFDRRKGYFTYL